MIDPVSHGSHFVMTPTALSQKSNTTSCRPTELGTYVLSLLTCIEEMADNVWFLGEVHPVINNWACFNQAGIKHTCQELSPTKMGIILLSKQA